MKIRLNHVNRLDVGGSLFTSLHSSIKNYQGTAAAVGTATGVPSEGLNNSLYPEKKP